MKKFIALGVALATLLFSFVPATSMAYVNWGVQAREDICPEPSPRP